MKLLLRLIISILFVMIHFTISSAQLSYSFSAVAGSYTSNTFATAVFGVNDDDDLSAAITMPGSFTFPYNCQTYNQFMVSTNGWLSLGNSANDPKYYNDLTITSQGPIIAPLWDDLKTSSSSSNVNYKLATVAGVKVLTIEWLNMLWDYSGTAGAISFQAKLYATGKIEFVYRQEAGSISIDGSTNTNGGASIGITSGSSGSDFYSLDGIGTAPNANYGSQTSSLNAKPATGQIYRWTPNGNMSFVSCTTVQPLTSNVSKCGKDEGILQVQVVISGSCSPISVSQFLINMNGSSIPGTNSNDVTKVNVYYSGTNSNLIPVNSFNSTVPATGTITLNGSQTLSDGTNYFWITYDINSTSATVGNVIDAQCTSVTVGGSAKVPTISSPAGSRSIAACAVSPGGVDNMAFWIKSNAGTSTTTNGSAISAWNDQSGNGRHALQATATNQPIYYDNITNNLNFNPVVDFDDAGQDPNNGDYMPIPSNGILASGNNPYAVYVVIVPGTNNSSTPGKFLFSGDNGYGGNHYNSFDIRSGNSFNDTWGLNDLVVSNQWTTGYPALETFDFDYTQRQMYNAGTAVGGSLLGNYRFADDNHCALGSQYASSPVTELYDGSIAEIVTYPYTAHNTTERNRVESYLALKYGVTLGHDYISSISTTVWSLSINGSYNNNIIGIARDDNSSLSQKQSKSTSVSSDVLTLAIGPTLQINQANNTGTFASGDQSFFVVGSNGGSVPNINVTTQIPSGITARLGRQWLSQKANFTNSDLMLVFDLTGSSSLNAADMRLLVDDNGDFTNAIVLASPTVNISVSGSVVTVIVDASNFTATPFFTLGSVVSGLPIVLTYFKAFESSGQVETVWQTGSETNNNYFELERSRDAQSFESIATIKGAGNSKNVNDYSYVDSHPYFGTSYYRLKQTDNNGNSSYFKMATVQIDLKGQIEISPNPVSLENISSVGLTGFETGKEVLVTLYDSHGNEVFSKVTITGSTGNTVLGIDPSSNLSSGLYYITASSDQMIYNLKLIITGR